jgi:serine/threonine-protein kinase HipA
VAQVSADKKKIIHGQQELQPGFAHWMIKFPSSQDARDVGAIEYAYSLMAKDAGVEISETHLFCTRRNKYFGTKRFDRDGDTRIHMHSLGGLIHADHRSPSLDYDMVLRVTLALTRNIKDAEKAYALACFNVLAHNRDDHVKNFSFLLNARNEWIFAPAYDLVFSYGPGGEQSMLVIGQTARVKKRTGDSGEDEKVRGQMATLCRTGRRFAKIHQRDRRQDRVVVIIYIILSVPDTDES